MPHIDMDQLSNEAKVWVFGISPSLDDGKAEVLLSSVDQFLDRWAAHGTPIRSGRTLLHGSFLVVAADETSETSGCSIDAMFGTLKRLEQHLGVSILDSTRVFYRDGDAVRTVSRNDFRGVASPDSVVFDVTTERLADVRSGAWVRRAADSWHRQLLQETA